MNSSFSLAKFLSTLASNQPTALYSLISTKMFYAASTWSYKALPSIGTWLQVPIRDYLNNFSYCISWISNIPFNIGDKVINDFKPNQISEPIADNTGSIQEVFLRFCSLEPHLVPNSLLGFSQSCKDLTTNHCERKLHNQCEMLFLCLVTESEVCRAASREEGIGVTRGWGVSKGGWLSWNSGWQMGTPGILSQAWDEGQQRLEPFIMGWIPYQV